MRAMVLVSAAIWAALIIVSCGARIVAPREEVTGMAREYIVTRSSVVYEETKIVAGSEEEAREAALEDGVEWTEYRRVLTEVEEVMLCDTP